MIIMFETKYDQLYTFTSEDMNEKTQFYKNLPNSVMS